MTDQISLTGKLTIQDTNFPRAFICPGKVGEFYPEAKWQRCTIHFTGIFSARIHHAKNHQYSGGLVKQQLLDVLS